MTKRKAESQTGNLTPDHKKSRIDPTPLHAGGVWHAVGMLSTRATTSVETLAWSEVYTRSYSPTKLRDFQPPHMGVLGQKTIQMPLPQGGAEYTIWGKVVASPESRPWWVLWIRGRPWWVLWVRGCPWLVLAPKVFQPCANQLVCWFFVGLCEWVNYLSLFLVPSRSSSTPLYPSKVLRVRERAPSP
jgi:hypothetical protein